MTDDERMDRARRIREMREGSRPTDEESSDDQPTGDADAAAEAGDAAAGGDEAAADPQDANPETTEQATTDGGDSPTESDADAGDADDTASGPTTDAADADDSPAESADDDVTSPEGESDDGGTIHIPGTEVGDVDVDVEAMAEQAGLTSTTEGADEEAVEPAAPGAAARAEAAETESREETRVLEFALGDEQYCLDIEYVEEIVKRETVTRVPNTPDCVEGVVDLRGQITTILDPKVLLDIPEEGSKDLIVVFDPEEFDDQGAVGWVVDDVNQVTPITDDEVNESPVDQDHVNGVVDRDGDFVIWTTPELDLDEVAG